MARPGNKAFDYVRAILATKDPCSDSPVLFAIGRVYKAHVELSRYIDLLFQGPGLNASGFLGGELKRAVSEAFSNIACDAIGNGAPPSVDCALSDKEAREILVLTKKIRSSYPDSFIEQKWDAACCRWIELASCYGSQESWIPNGLGRWIVTAAIVGVAIGALYHWWASGSRQQCDVAEADAVKMNGPLEASGVQNEDVRGTCAACDGAGRIDVLEMCPTCRGIGFVNCVRKQARIRLRCRDCGGRGTVHWDRTCPFCLSRSEIHMCNEAATSSEQKISFDWRTKLKSMLSEF